MLYVWLCVLRVVIAFVNISLVKQQVFSYTKVIFFKNLSMEQMFHNRFKWPLEFDNRPEWVGGWVPLTGNEDLDGGRKWARRSTCVVSGVGDVCALNQKLRVGLPSCWSKSKKNGSTFYLQNREHRFERIYLDTTRGLPA